MCNKVNYSLIIFLIVVLNFLFHLRNADMSFLCIVCIGLTRMMYSHLGCNKNGILYLKCLLMVSTSCDLQQYKPGYTAPPQVHPTDAAIDIKYVIFIIFVTLLVVYI